jgi:hypothetical protein
LASISLLSSFASSCPFLTISPSSTASESILPGILEETSISFVSTIPVTVDCFESALLLINTTIAIIEITIGIENTM